MAFASCVAVPALTLDANDGTRVCLDGARGPCSDARGFAESKARDWAFVGRGFFCSALAVTGASDSGGDGGVCASEAVSDLSGGVDAVGDSGVTPLASLAGLLARRFSTAMADGFRARRPSIVSSASLNFSNVISFSTLRSLNSSLSRCVSMRSSSRSCSPCLIVSSSKTPRSIVALYLLSISSKLVSVFRACLS